MSRHTPGPWEWVKPESGGDDYDYMYLAGPDDAVVLGSPCAHEIVAEDEDAHLISAAPDMLEALELFVDGGDKHAAMYDMARAAIAKARGETDG